MNRTMKLARLSPAVTMTLTLAIAFAGAAVTVIPASAFAATPAAHDHHDAPAAKQLAPGQRWATDAPLRQGMTRIRTTLEPRLDAIHQDRAKPADYHAIAKQVETQVAYIVSNCKLPPDADAALHVTIGQMMESAETMAGKSKVPPQEGAVKLVAALEKYGSEFDHPGWKPLKH